MNRFTIPFFLLCLLSFGNVTGQTAVVDSLKAELEKDPPIDEKIDLLVNLSLEYLNIDIPEAIKYTDLILLEIPNIQSPELVMKSYYYMARVRMQGTMELDKAEGYIKKGAEIADKENSHKWRLQFMRLLAPLYSFTNRPNEALELNLEVVKIVSEQKDSIALGGTYSNIGSLYETILNQEKANEYYKKAIDVLEKINYQPYLVMAYGGYAKTHENLDSAIVYHKKAINVANELYASESMNVIPYRGIGEAYFKKEEYRKSLKWFRKAILVSERTKDEANLNQAYIYMGMAFNKLNMADSVIHYLNPAYDFFKKENFTQEMPTIAEILGPVLAEKGRHKKAFEVMKSGFVARDSLITKEKTAAIAETTAKYETAEKEAKIARQQLEIAHQKTIQNRTVFGGIIALMLASGIYFWYYQNQRRKKQAAEAALELEQAKAANLLELDSLKSKFFTNISHELRTPLTLITGPLENAMEKAKTPRVKKDIQLAHSNSKKLLTLVNEILDLSKLESGKLQLNESVANLDQLLRRIFFSFKSLTEIQGIKLVFESNIKKDLFIKTDIEKLEKIGNNLIANAIKYTPAGGSVTLSADIMDGRLKMDISDTGKGIHPDDLPKVFDRFYQSGQKDEPMQGGTGIGLALARELARLFGGDLTVSSGLGKGSIFNLNMPIKEAEGNMQAIEMEKTEKAKTSPVNYAPILFGDEKPKLLIIEDNPEMSDYLVNILSPAYNCSTARNGKQGLDILQKKNFDLITCDVMMPEMDGFELRQKINENKDLRHTPFIFLTARALEDDKIKGLQLGVDDYITKPFSKTELLVRIHNLLKNKSERDIWQKENRREKEDVPESAEEQLLRQAEHIVLENLENGQFKVSDLAKNIGYSQRSLGRIIKKATGLSSVNFILEIRLQKARQLLEKRRFLTVAEVRYEVGIESPSYFTTKFTERFGKNPKEYLENTVAGD